MLFFHRINRTDTQYSPESASLNWENHGNDYQNNSGHQRKESYRRNKRAMKEKLLMRDVAADLFDVEPDPEDQYGIEANYTIQSTDGKVMAQKFHQTRVNTKYQSNDTIEPIQDL